MKKSLPWIIGCIIFILALWGVIELAGQSGNNLSPASGTHVNLPLTENDWIRGNANASVTLIEYSDLQCPACGAYYPLVKQLKDTYPTELRVVYRHFPLTTLHRNAKPAARAAEAAGRQGKFWEMHDLLFERQSDWSNAGNTSEKFSGYAKDLGLDADRFIKDMGSNSIDDNINAGTSSGIALGVQGTPTFFLNGTQIQNPRSVEEFKKLVDDAIRNAPPQKENSSASNEYHAHTDLLVMINGKPLDLSQDKYQSTHGKELNPDAHLHDGKPNILHVHKEKVTIGNFVSSLGISLTDTCLALDTAERYCAEGKARLQLFVNGNALIPNSEADIPDYEPRDLDRILLTYGSNEKEIKQQLALVSDEACIYSEKCPERGVPPTEECVGGLGTKCD